MAYYFKKNYETTKNKTMETLNEKSIKVLNDLIEINNDRIEGYERAIKETEDHELETIFTSNAAVSRQFRSELISQVIQNGGTPTEGTTLSGKVYRGWMDIKSTVTGNYNHAILSSCEYGEDAALDVYEEALQSDDLTTKAREIVLQQQSGIEKAHNHIRALRDSAKVNK
ncbi:PA2169 family four-helix-bundle protein [soil metagenome]